jgi:hypothetical protein
MKPHPILLATLLLTPLTETHATEFHVSINGKDANSGKRTAPLRTIQRAAELAQPGDVITVHEGVYRERINPPRGGQSDHPRSVRYRRARKKQSISWINAELRQAGRDFPGFFRAGEIGTER